MKAKLDFLFLGLLGAISINTLIQSALYQYLLSINNYIGFSLLVVVFLIRIVKPKAGRYCTGFLLLFSTLNILNYGIGRMAVSFSFEPIGFDPIMFMLIIPYYFINKRSINQKISGILHGSAEEQLYDQKKKVQVYLGKFEKYNSEELEKALLYLKDYPVQAQIALEHLQKLNRNTSSADSYQEEKI